MGNTKTEEPEDLPEVQKSILEQRKSEIMPKGVYNHWKLKGHIAWNKGKKTFDRKAWSKIYRQKPEVKKRGEVYEQTSERKAWKKVYNKEYRQIHKEEIKIQHKEYQENHRKQIQAQKKAYMEAYYQRPKIKAYKKEYNQRLEVKARKKAYQQTSESKTYLKEYMKRMRRLNLQLLLGNRLRVRFFEALKKYGNGKTKISKKYGIDWTPAIKKLVETKPLDFNERKYHIDHAIPLSAFDLTDMKQIQMAFNPDNLQWLTAEENLSKHDKII